ncbi:archease [Goodfellowiella coeruleoviolacea]|uniref:SHS2 domain-containing protein n=1 Tax=Goodfellowiella coeruleoviolacea TaxID=334858 RepID=A0AAE3G9R1_9PSEU|nr:archease [Goodfellowiella coeruleoviolacea]MCP2164261.1 SHS2 domain-containing protein [Goodfellowiella coeruleoviolacea]
MTADRPPRGHRGLPHTADIRIQAWAPTEQECLAEAVAALVDSFADTAGASAQRVVESDLTADSAEDALVAVLDEVIYLLDTEGVVPLDVAVDRGARGPRLRMAVTPVDALDVTGAVPKAVTLHGLRMARDERGWTGTATIDV